MADTPDAIRRLVGIDNLDAQPGLQEEGASWKTRLKQAAYTSPSNNRFEFQYENVSQEITKRDVAFDFPDIDDSYVQQNGYSARRYPMRCYFSGTNHDITATQFIGALLEKGVGSLEHPMYGTFDCVPFGDIRRIDDLKDAANQSCIEVVFFTTTGAVYPSLSIDPTNEIQRQVELFNILAAAQFDDLQKKMPQTIAHKANLAANIRGKLATASKFLGKIAAVDKAVLNDFRSVQSDINLGIDVLVGQPLQLAQQTINMLQAPAYAAASIRDRLAGYADFAQSIINSPAYKSNVTVATIRSIVSKLQSDFTADDVSVMAAVSGSVVSVINNTFTTKTEALTAAETILNQLGTAVTWRDDNFANLDMQDGGDSYQGLQQCVALVAGYLIQISFTLLSESTIVLDRDRTIIDLAAELYGSVDDRLDFLASSNNIGADEWLELKRGRVIKYYV